MGVVDSYEKAEAKKEEEDPKKIQGNIKLNIETNEACVHKPVLVSPGSTQLRRMETSIREFIDQTGKEVLLYRRKEGRRESSEEERHYELGADLAYYWDSLEEIRLHC